MRKHQLSINGRSYPNKFYASRRQIFIFSATSIILTLPPFEPSALQEHLVIRCHLSAPSSKSYNLPSIIASSRATVVTWLSFFQQLRSGTIVEVAIFLVLSSTLQQASAIILLLLLPHYWLLLLPPIIGDTTLVLLFASPPPLD
jgi:hypothetical protein